MHRGLNKLGALLAPGEDKKLRMKKGKGTFKSSDFTEYMGGKKCLKEFFPRPESSRHLQMKAAAVRQYASALHNGYTVRYPESIATLRFMNVP